jgi:signal transduction histidine kinase
MPHTDSAHTATHPESDLFSSEFDCCDVSQGRHDEPMALLLHELRSPLAAIQNAIAILRLHGGEETLRQRMHELIERQVQQIAVLTSRPSPLSGLSLESLMLQRTRIELGAVLTRAVETAAPEFIRRLNHVLVTLPESTTWVLGDASRLEQVFVNLLTNASKYSELGGAIVVSMLVSNGHAVVQVRDFGIGIAAAAMPSIFNLFVRSNTAAVRKRPGLGIGLALVRSILESHGGTVSATSEGLGKGSAFTVRLKIDD